MEMPSLKNRDRPVQNVLDYHDLLLKYLGVGRVLSAKQIFLLFFLFEPMSFI